MPESYRPCGFCKLFPGDGKKCYEASDVSYSVKGCDKFEEREEEGMRYKMRKALLNWQRD